jgi:flagellar export protein FliJ
MKTRFTPLVKVKKNNLDKCERDLLKANEDKKSAELALDEAYKQLKEINLPTHGKISDMLQERTILQIQRNIIQQRHSWLNFASKQVEQFKEILHKSAIEYEKYKYLETKEIELILKKRAQEEMKTLDESALQSYMYKQENR